jgi:antitoxin component YwqK of YwqJK toxin-antitoxin module
MVKKILISGIVLIFIGACSSIEKKEYTNANGNYVVEEWYNKENLKSQTIFLTADSSEYIYCSWYESGELKDSARYVNNVVDGLRKYYDQKAKLLNIENYANGILNGPHKAIYENGIAGYDGYHLNELKVGEWKFHFPDGRPITYEFYDSTGKLLYFRKYNESGGFANSNGSAIIAISADSTFVDLVLANPPNCNVTLIISDDASTELCNTKVKNTHTICPLVPDENGKKLLNIQLNITDNAGHVERHEQKFEFPL